MDKTVVLAVAGSGKTRLIIESLNLEEQFLIVTYTVNNTKNLRERIIAKFGYFPTNVEVHPYFTFLYSFCVMPFLGYKLKCSGIYWDSPPEYTRNLNERNSKRYKTSSGRLYHNRMAKLLTLGNVFDDIRGRLEKYYDCVFIDEVQDFGGHDFKFLEEISKSTLRITFVGDYYQHTYDTSRDGNVNKNLHKDYSKYKQKFSKLGFYLDTTSLKSSYRCSTQTCEFISNNLGIDITSCNENITEVLFINNQERIRAIYNDNSIVKLFFQGHYKYDCRSKNWGGSKGEDCYQDVCVVLNPTTMKHYHNDSLHELNPMTKNKLYVACSRAKGNLYLVPERMLKDYKVIRR